MIDKTHLSPTRAATPLSTPAATTAQPDRDVARTRLRPAVGETRFHNTFNVFTRGGVMYPSRQYHHANHRDFGDAHGHVSAVIGIGFIGSLLVLALGCILVQFCKSFLAHWRQESTPQQAERRRTSRRRYSDEEERAEELGDVTQSRVARENSWTGGNDEDGLPLLTVVPPPPPNNQPTPDIAEAAGGPDPCTASGSGDVFKPKSHSISEQHSVQPASVEYLQLGGPEAVLQDTVQDPDIEFPGRFSDVTCSDVLNKIANEEGDRRDSCAYNTDVATVSELSSENDDMSDYLAALVFDVTEEAEDSDVTDGLLSRGVYSQSPETDEGGERSSDESFSRLQDVKAQAEFSPYHLAWSMPRLHGHGFRRRSCSLSASTLVAKNLNTQLLGREDPDETICPTNTESGPAAVHTESYAEPVENMRDRRSSSSDNGSTDSDCSGYIWSFQIPSDEEIARDTPIASEFHSPPQLRSSKTPCGPPGALAYAHEEDEGQEYQPLLAYTVTDYRKNLTMNGVCSMNCNTPSSEKTPASCLDTSSVCHNRSPCPGSHPYNNSVVSKSTLKMFPGTDRRGWDNLELTPQKVQDCSLEETGITSSSCVEECRSLLDEGLEVRCEPQNQEISLDDTINNNDVVLKDSHLLPADSPTDMTSGETSLIACGLISTVTPSSGKIRDANANISNVGGGTVHHSTLFTFDREQTSVGPSSPPRKQLEQLDNFKTPFPVNTVRVKSSTAWSRRKMNDPQTAGLSKSKSSTSNTPRTDAALEVQKTPVLRRSRTLESIYSPAQVYQQLVSVGSASTGSVVSSVSRLSLHDDDDSFMWDNEFSAFNRVAEESLAWEDDPYLK